MANEGATRQIKDGESARLEDLAEKVRRIQPGRWRMVSRICVGGLSLGYALWRYHSGASERGIEYLFIYFWSMGCVLTTLFFSDLALWFRLKVLLIESGMEYAQQIAPLSGK
jgi:hypothetical protein